jgi:hypothetical protein
MARPGWSSSRPSTVARWYSTDSAPIIRIQPTGSHPVSTNPAQFPGKPPACNRVLFVLWFIRVRKPCKEAFLWLGSNGK